MDPTPTTTKRMRRHPRKKSAVIALSNFDDDELQEILRQTYIGIMGIVEYDNTHL
ncbi:hypothetical protein PM082_022097 [Marasmius tenuissimus]|nr:hypothetical protein PM082_022097 [Marasmius tenuissimus]